jgi:hypothetical protein
MMVKRKGFGESGILKQPRVSRWLEKVGGHWLIFLSPFLSLLFEVLVLSFRVVYYFILW